MFSLLILTKPLSIFKIKKIIAHPNIHEHLKNHDGTMMY